jgi:hypothetical protein
MRATAFGLLNVGSGIAAYLALAWYIESTSHTVVLKPAFFVSVLGFATLFATALRVAWTSWRGWSIPIAVGIVVTTVFALYLLYFLPFP